MDGLRHSRKGGGVHRGCTGSLSRSLSLSLALSLSLSLSLALSRSLSLSFLLTRGVVEKVVSIEAAQVLLYNLFFYNLAKHSGRIQRLCPLPRMLTYADVC
jgi:hypothetical protein